MLLIDPARPRRLQTLSPGTGDTVEALAAPPERIYWLRSVDGAGGGPEQASIWTPGEQVRHGQGEAVQVDRRRRVGDAVPRVR